eukprot:gnl/MRDRNA2_/MRDRNA2_67335_c0_seq1.p1 gnl/MRDRNA2_/MRDRNA2_67335_c0~~gnl/MRDRNA2_/MRDRNA2_67335_c0_seq1.p1  ORF type:complete len:150 (+),score=23.74 gnl/MRDRNA2_/MRDRNA2_67335_c0_seq1:37-450(+)
MPLSLRVVEMDERNARSKVQSLSAIFFEQTALAYVVYALVALICTANAIRMVAVLSRQLGPHPYVCAFLVALPELVVCLWQGLVDVRGDQTSNYKFGAQHLCNEDQSLVAELWCSASLCEPWHARLLLVAIFFEAGN